MRVKTGFPEVRLLVAEPLQDYFDDGYGNRWSVARLIDDTKHLKAFNAPIAALDLSGRIWSGADMALLAYHVKKVNDADLQRPIIIAWDGSIADGRHRIIKALIEGKKTIKAVRMTWRPTPCSTNN